MRKKIPQLQEALAGRFEIAHHGVLVAGLLAHIDALDQAIATLEARIDIHTQPHADLIELLCTIPGVKRRAAQVLIAECGLDMTVFPTAQHLASWAAICPGNNQSGRRRNRGKTRRGDTWPAHHPHPGSPRRRPQQEHLHRLPLLADPRPPRHPQSDRRDPPRHLDRLLLHRPRPRPVPRTRRRLARPPQLSRTPNPPTRQTTPSARPPRHPRNRRLTTSSPTLQPPVWASGPTAHARPTRCSTPPSFTP